jgi:hypothetical protein
MTLDQVKMFIWRYGEAPRSESPEATLWRLFHEMKLIEGDTNAKTAE